MGKAHSGFQTKTAQKTLPDGAAHTYIAYIRKCPPPGHNVLPSDDIIALISGFRVTEKRPTRVIVRLQLQILALLQT